MTAMVVEHERAEVWREDARAMLEQVAALGEPFTTDDLYTLGLPPEPHGNLMNKVLRDAAGEGLIVKVGVTTSKRRERKHGYTGIWKSPQAAEGRLF